MFDGHARAQMAMYVVYESPCKMVSITRGLTAGSRARTSCAPSRQLDETSSPGGADRRVYRRRALPGREVVSSGP